MSKIIAKRVASSIVDTLNRGAEVTEADLAEAIEFLLVEKKSLTQRCSKDHHEVEWFNPMIKCPVCEMRAKSVKSEGWCPP